MAEPEAGVTGSAEHQERLARRRRTGAVCVALGLVASLAFLHDTNSFGLAISMGSTASPDLRMWARMELLAMILLAATVVLSLVARTRWSLLAALNLPGALSIWLQSRAVGLDPSVAPMWNVGLAGEILPAPLTGTVAMVMATWLGLAALNVMAVAWTPRPAPALVPLRTRLSPKRWIPALAVNPILLPFGPIFSKDVRVLGRRRATYWARTLYPLGLLAVVSLAYFAAVSDAGATQGAWRIQKLQEVAPALAVTIGWFQFILLLLIAPVLTGPAICEERRTRTLASLMTTPMTSAQIVFSSFAGRMVQLLILSLVAAPLLLAVRVFGGLEPEAIVAFSAITVGAMSLMAALGLLFSVWCRRAVTASVMAVLGFLLLTIAPMMVLVLVMIRVGGGRGGPPLWIIPLSAPVSLGAVTSQMVGGGGPRFGIHTIWTMNLAVNLGLTALVLLGATAALRRVMLRDSVDIAAPVRKSRRRRRRGAGGGGRRADSLAPQAEAAPPPGGGAEREGVSHVVGDRPVLWRELRAPALGSTRNLVLAVLVIAGLLAWLYYELAITDDALHYAVSVVAVLLLCIQAATAPSMAIAGERESQTWHVLLTTPLDGAEILFSKFLGALRKCWVCAAALGVHLCIGIAAGALRPSVLLHMAVIVLGACAFLSGTGMLWSLLLRTGTRAAAANVGMAVLLWMGVPMVGAMVAEATDDFRRLGLHDLFEGFARIWYAANPICMTVSTIDGATDGSGGPDYEFFDDRLGFVAFTAVVLVSSTVCAGIGVGAVGVASRLFQRVSGRSS